MQNKPDMNDVAAALLGINLIEEIGEGGFKVVYRGEVNGTEEAIKIVRIPVDPADDAVEESNRRRLNREIELLRQSECPFLVKLGSIVPFDFQIGVDKYVCYSEELIQGPNLRNRIKPGCLPSQQELATLGGCLISVIIDLSSRDAIHRDIKPLNIVVTDDTDRPYVILDLGIVFMVGQTNYTIDSRVVPGSRYYRAPEMMDVDFRNSLDYRADLYTMGLTLYEFASGVNPFMVRGDSTFDTMYRIKHQKAPALESHRADLNKVFCALVDQLINKRPSLRPANLAQLKTRMENFK